MLIKMIHVGGKHSSMWTKEALDVLSVGEGTANLITARMNTYMHAWLQQYAHSFIW